MFVAVLKKAFDAFDREKSGSISTNMVEEILRLMGQPFNRNTLEELIDEVDADSKHKQSFYVLRASCIGIGRCSTHE
jgi:Ca2+-binding EF-hand superfamily protein